THRTGTELPLDSQNMVVRLDHRRRAVRFLRWSTKPSPSWLECRGPGARSPCRQAVCGHCPVDSTVSSRGNRSGNAPHRVSRSGGALWFKLDGAAAGCRLAPADASQLAGKAGDSRAVWFLAALVLGNARFDHDVPAGRG